VRRAFTLMELLIACSIGAVVLTSVMTMLTGVWMLAKENSDELQGALRARFVREKLYYGCFDDNGAKKGLINATNVTVSADELVAAFKTGQLSIRPVKPADLVIEELDPSDSNEYRDATTNALQYVYLAVRTGSAVYYNRMVVPVWGRHPNAGEMYECFGK